MQQQAVAAGRAMARPARRRRFDPLPYLMVAPALIAIGLFSLVPTLYGMLISVYRVEFVQLLRFVGVANYSDVLADPKLWNSMRVSFTFTALSMAFSVSLGFALALIANHSVRFRSTFRTIALLPWVTSYVVTYLIFRWILNADLGLLNAFFVELLGWSRVQWLGNPVLALGSLIVVNVWRDAPYAMVLLLAGLQGVPQELYEAAGIDGANRWRSFIAITLPLMKSALLVLVVLTTIQDFNVVVAMLVLTGGGPGTATETMSLRMYYEAFTNARMGTAAAIAMIIFGINVLLTLVYVRLLRTERYY